MRYSFQMHPRKRELDLVVQSVRDEMIVYDTNTFHGIHLGSVPAFVWQRCDGEHSIEVIAQQLGAHLGVADARDLVLLAIDELQHANLLLAKGVAAPEITGTRRRELLRAFASVLGIAIVLGPRTVHAGSSSH